MYAPVNARSVVAVVGITRVYPGIHWQSDALSGGRRAWPWTTMSILMIRLRFDLSDPLWSASSPQALPYSASQLGTSPQVRQQ